LCSFKEGKFWEYHDLIFENQKKLSRDTLLNLAQEIGIDLPRFEQCLASEETTNLLKEDAELGKQLEVQGTPTVFINGHAFRDWSYPERLQLVIESEIQKAR